MDTGAGGWVIAGTAPVRAEIPRLRGGGAEDSHALAVFGKAGHRFERWIGFAPRWTGRLGLGAPSSLAEIALDHIEIAGEIAGRNLLRGKLCRAPAIVEFSLTYDFAADHDDVSHVRFKAGPLPHDCGSFFIGHVPELGNRLAIKCAIALALELRDASPR